MAVTENWKSGQIPAFGNWDYVNELPITQYFECARDAGLIRYSCSGDLYGVHDFRKAALPLPPRKATKDSGNRRWPSQVKVCDVTETARKHVPALTQQKRFPKKSSDSNSSSATNAAAVKAVDEDLYKIPPELLHSSKRKKMLGLFSRCLMPPCRV